MGFKKSISSNVIYLDINKNLQWEKIKITLIIFDFDKR